VRPACNREAGREFRGEETRAEDPFRARDGMSKMKKLSPQAAKQMSAGDIARLLDLLAWRLVALALATEPAPR
jgi:hypothetical protein